MTVMVCELCGTKHYILGERRFRRHGFGCELCERDFAAVREDAAAYEKLDSIGETMIDDHESQAITLSPTEVDAAMPNLYRRIDADRPHLPDGYLLPHEDGAAGALAWVLAKIRRLFKRRAKS